MANLKFRYVFKMEGGQSPFVYSFELDPETLLMVTQPSVTHPWTELEYHKCSHCPYSSQNFRHCPVARNLSHTAEAFKKAPSFSKTEIYVEGPERTYYKKSSLQDGLFSIFGIIMATSDCPYMDFLRPLARFHLPFASMEETLVRICSFYLLGQYFERDQGEGAKVTLKDLEQKYADVEKVNIGILDRINHISSGDADKNAMVILHTLAQMMQMQLSSNMDLIRPLVIAKKRG